MPEIERVLAWAWDHLAWALPKGQGEAERQRFIAQGVATLTTEATDARD